MDSVPKKSPISFSPAFNSPFSSYFFIFVFVMICFGGAPLLSWSQAKYCLIPETIESTIKLPVSQSCCRRFTSLSNSGQADGSLFDYGPGLPAGAFHFFLPPINGLHTGHNIRRRTASFFSTTLRKIFAPRRSIRQ